MTDYMLNTKGELEWVDIRVDTLPHGLLFSSPIDGDTYIIDGMTEADLMDERVLHGQYIDEILNMVGAMGGGLWPDDPDGTQTTYEYFPQMKIFMVREK